ncbi:hypothetical protein LX32DRAFT_58900 [Colletotrichum zoysiae]|uniref:Uncharacterized protein n=1 Tax=Colletotrichum zoysiae TaxID=1216348 RepID=A0AAD9HRC2_9PEZI|nr:hypothetical protein LX32DRAFT_58900 [Colletotrichum zoysiae]
MNVATLSDPCVISPAARTLGLSTAGKSTKGREGKSRPFADPSPTSFRSRHWARQRFVKTRQNGRVQSEPGRQPTWSQQLCRCHLDVTIYCVRPAATRPSPQRDGNMHGCWGLPRCLATGMWSRPAEGKLNPPPQRQQDWEELYRCRPPAGNEALPALILVASQRCSPTRPSSCSVEHRCAPRESGVRTGGGRSLTPCSDVSPHRHFLDKSPLRFYSIPD